MKYTSIPWNSMEHWVCHFNQFHVRFPGLLWNIPWNYMEIWSRQIKNHRVPWDSMELGGRHFKWHRCSMEFHGIFHGTLVRPNEISHSSMEFHGTLRLSFYSMPYYSGLPWDIPWNSMESPNKKSSSSMGFHGIRRAPYQMTQVFHGIPWNIPWKSMELWHRQMKYNLVPWNSMEHSMEFHGTLVPPNELDFYYLWRPAMINFLFLWQPSRLLHLYTMFTYDFLVCNMCINL